MQKTLKPQKIKFIRIYEEKIKEKYKLGNN